ncbi:MAG: hypothetical protein JSW67_00875 [Candidatus Latescibacterota bacterium]|nr:MAG: hypothetical protein JSW67_00875 [Candidatus Latescibacterota bacterium]
MPSLHFMLCGVPHEHPSPPARRAGFTLIELMNAVGSVTINVNAISGANLVMQEVGECPSSQNVDFHDYRVHP